MHNISTVTHLTPEPPGGYAADAPVHVVKADGSARPGRLNDDIEGGGVLAFIAGGGAVGAYVEPPGRLAERKAALSRQVDADAEAVRLKYITPGSGMSMTYREKFEQALEVIALGELSANALTEAQRIDQYPTIAASVGLEAETLFACAQLVQQKYEAFADLSYGIERTRLAGKAAIAAASDVAGVESAYASITWTV